MPVLARAWQMLLKGLEEVQTAPSPMQAAEMVLVRLAYVADLPVAGRAGPRAREGDRRPAAGAAAHRLQRRCARAAASPAPAARGSPPTPAPAAPRPIAGEGLRGAESRLPCRPRSPAAPPDLRRRVDPMPQSFAEVVALFDKQREALIRSHLWSHVHLVQFEPGRIEFRPAAGAPRDLANRLGQLLERVDRRCAGWSRSREAEGEPTLREQAGAARQRDLRNEVAAHPLVRAVLETFPGRDDRRGARALRGDEVDAGELPGRAATR